MALITKLSSLSKQIGGQGGSVWSLCILGKMAALGIPTEMLVIVFRFLNTLSKDTQIATFKIMHDLAGNCCSDENVKYVFNILWNSIFKREEYLDEEINFFRTKSKFTYLWLVNIRDCQ